MKVCDFWAVILTILISLALIILLSTVLLCIFRCFFIASGYFIYNINKNLIRGRISNSIVFCFTGSHVDIILHDLSVDQLFPVGLCLCRLSDTIMERVLVDLFFFTEKTSRVVVVCVVRVCVCKWMCVYLSCSGKKCVLRKWLIL